MRTFHASHGVYGPASLLAAGQGVYRVSSQAGENDFAEGIIIAYNENPLLADVVLGSFCPRIPNAGDVSLTIGNLMWIRYESGLGPRPVHTPPPPTVNRTLLYGMIADAESIIYRNYTLESWERLQTAISDARAVYNYLYATQDQIDDAVISLRGAMDGLEVEIDQPPITDRYALNAAIAEAESRIQENYTPLSWGNLQGAVELAVDIRDNLYAAQEHIDSVTELLWTAINALELVYGTIPNPTPEPTPEPTISPTPEPTAEPTISPTPEPTPEPTISPTPEPTVEPTISPTPEPTPEPTISPTPEPTPEPTISPTPEPTVEPTISPTPEPTVEPTIAPTPEPTVEPTISPTPEPTPEPTISPTPEPTPEPTISPTPEPTPESTLSPTPEPTPEPTVSPTSEPTSQPTPSPPPEPTLPPTPAPTLLPTPSPTPTPPTPPTPHPTPRPTPRPTPSPTPLPTPVPSPTPTPQPTGTPVPPLVHEHEFPPPYEPTQPIEPLLRFVIGDSTFTHNGITVAGDAAPFIVDGRAHIPLRVIAEALGAVVTWDNVTRTGYMTLNGVTISIVIDMPLPDGMGTPVVINGRTFVPGRYISETFGATVRWDRDNHVVYIYPPQLDF